MSRTVRRKGFKHTRTSSGKTEGFKTNGHFTTWDRAEAPINGHQGRKIYRPMTKEEVRAEMKFFHGESKHKNARGPSNYYRYMFQLAYDRFNDTQLKRCLDSNGEYDPVFIATWPKENMNKYW